MHLSWKIKVAFTLSIVIIFLAGAYYYAFFAIRFKRVNVETFRVTSPDKLYDCILIVSDAGAMTYAWYLVYIKPAGEKVNKKDYGVFAASRLYGEKIYWKDANTLTIEYDSARIFSFRNYYTIQNGDKYRDINIEEICTRNK